MKFTSLNILTRRRMKKLSARQEKPAEMVKVNGKVRVKVRVRGKVRQGVEAKEVKVKKLIFRRRGATGEIKR